MRAPGTPVRCGFLVWPCLDSGRPDPCVVLSCCLGLRVSDDAWGTCVCFLAAGVPPWVGCLFRSVVQVSVEAVSLLDVHQPAAVGTFGTSQHCGCQLGTAGSAPRAQAPPAPCVPPPRARLARPPTLSWSCPTNVPPSGKKIEPSRVTSPGFRRT